MAKDRLIVMDVADKSDIKQLSVHMKETTTIPREYKGLNISPNSQIVIIVFMVDWNHPDMMSGKLT